MNHTNQTKHEISEHYSKFSGKQNSKLKVQDSILNVVVKNRGPFVNLRYDNSWIYRRFNYYTLRVSLSSGVLLFTKQICPHF